MVPWRIAGIALLAMAATTGCTTAPLITPQEDTVTLQRSDYVEQQIALRAANGQIDRLTADNARLRSDTDQLRVELARIRADLVPILKRMPVRAAAHAAGSLASLPAKSVPGVGVAVAVVGTGLDLREACVLMLDIKQIERVLGEQLVSDDDLKVCDIPMPSISEIKLPSIEEVVRMLERMKARLTCFVDSTACKCESC